MFFFFFFLESKAVVSKPIERSPLMIVYFTFRTIHWKGEKHDNPAIVNSHSHYPFQILYAFNVNCALALLLSHEHSAIFLPRELMGFFLGLCSHHPQKIFVLGS